MKLFVDTADSAEIKLLAATGLFDGVTTNPSLVAKSGKRVAEVIAEICAAVLVTHRRTEKGFAAFLAGRVKTWSKTGRHIA